VISGSRPGTTAGDPLMIEGYDAGRACRARRDPIRR
jgi:hypothetical protein